MFHLYRIRVIRYRYSECIFPKTQQVLKLIRSFHSMLLWKNGSRPWIETFRVSVRKNNLPFQSEIASIHLCHEFNCTNRVYDMDICRRVEFINDIFRAAAYLLFPGWKNRQLRFPLVTQPHVKKANPCRNEKQLESTMRILQLIAHDDSHFTLPSESVGVWQQRVFAK